MRKQNQIGIDSQCLSYVIDAMDNNLEPVGSLADEKLALVRLFFYCPETLWVTRTVRDECSRINSNERAALHAGFISAVFGEKPIQNSLAVEIRADFLLQFHPNKRKDCLVVAEAEDVGHDVLLSYDFKFLNRLSSKTKGVFLTRPSDYWRGLGILQGTLPDKRPHTSNPLAEQAWWIW